MIFNKTKEQDNSLTLYYFAEAKYCDEVYCIMFGVRAAHPDGSGNIVIPHELWTEETRVIISNEDFIKGVRVASEYLCLRQVFNTAKEAEECVIDWLRNPDSNYFKFRQLLAFDDNLRAYQATYRNLDSLPSDVGGTVVAKSSLLKEIEQLKPKVEELKRLLNYRDQWN